MPSIAPQFPLLEGLLFSGGAAVLPHYVMAVLYVTASAVTGRVTHIRLRSTRARLVGFALIVALLTVGLCHIAKIVAERAGVDFSLSAVYLALLLSAAALGATALGATALLSGRTRTHAAAPPEPNMQLSLLLGLFPGGALAVDRNGTIVAINAEAARLFDYTVQELTDRPIHQLLAATLHHQHQQALQDFFANPEHAQNMSSKRFVAGLNKHGDTVHLRIRLHHRELPDGALTFASIDSTSDTEQQKATALTQLNRLKRAMDASADGFWEWNPHTGAVWFNAAFIKMTHRTAHAHPSWNHWLSHIHKDDIERVKLELSLHLEASSQFEISYLGLTSDDRWEWMRLRGAKVFDEKNHPRLSGTLTNIHAAKRLEFALEEKARFNATLLNASLAGVYVYRLIDSEFGCINRRYTEITGYTLEELNGFTERGLKQLIHPHDQAKVREHWWNLFNANGHQPREIGYRIHHKSGRWLHCLARDAVHSRAADGKACEILGSLVDVTEVVTATDATNDVYHNLHSSVVHAPIALAQMTLAGELTFANHAFAELFNITAPELVGRPLTSLLPEASALWPGNTNHSPQQHAAPAECDIPWMAGRRDAGRRDAGRRDAGRRDAGRRQRWLRLASTRVPLAQGEGCVVVVTDITALKQATLAQAEVCQEFDQFIYSASHDLQEPLRKITAFVNALSRRLDSQLSDADARYELERVNDAAKRMSAMMKSLLDLSRCTSRSIELGKHHLAALVARAMEAEGLTLARHTPKFELLQDPLLTVDAAAFVELLQQLISNSLLHSGRSDDLVITISDDHQGGLHLLRFADNGAGVAEAHQQRVFEPFCRLVDKSVPGAGIGLSLARKIIKAHGGRLHAEPANPGFCVIIELPEEPTDAVC